MELNMLSIQKKGLYSKEFRPKEGGYHACLPWQLQPVLWLAGAQDDFTWTASRCAQRSTFTIAPCVRTSASGSSVTE